MNRAATLLLVFALIAGVSVGSASAQLGPQEDHFKVYTVLNPTPFPFTMPIVLSDQWNDDFFTDFLVLEKFATPAQKNNEPVYDVRRHQTWWSIFDPQPTREVVLENQFGPQTWLVRNAQYFVAPALKFEIGPPPIANHYKCYEAQGEPLGVPVFVADQFGLNDYVVLDPELFCNPAEKFEEATGRFFPIVNPEAHLACYRLDPPRFNGQTIFAWDQFSELFGTPWDIVLGEDCWLCVPSFKVRHTPVEKSTWGGIKLRYE